MKRPKCVKPKQWQLSLEVKEMNRRIIKRKRQSSMYVEDEIDEMLFNDGEYKANRKKNKK